MDNMAVLFLLTLVFQGAIGTTEDRVLYLDSKPGVFACPRPQFSYSKAWFINGQPLEASHVANICTTVGDGALIRCNVSRALDNVTLHCEVETETSDGRTFVHTSMYRLHVEDTLHAVNSFNLTGLTISWMPPTRARVAIFHVNISKDSVVLNSTSTVDTSIQLMSEELVECLENCSCCVSIVTVIVGGRQSPVMQLRVPQDQCSSQTTSSTEQPETTDATTSFSPFTTTESTVSPEMVASSNGKLAAAIVVPMIVIALVVTVIIICILCKLRHKRKLCSPASPSPTTPVSAIATTDANGGMESTERSSETTQLVSGKPNSNIRSRAPGHKYHRSLSAPSTCAGENTEPWC